MKKYFKLMALLVLMMFANVNVAMAQKSEPYKITLESSGSDINLKWASDDKLMLCFEHGTNIYHKDAPIIPESISADGKSAKFNITVPAEIPANATFNLYGVYQKTNTFGPTNGGYFNSGTQTYLLEQSEADCVTLNQTGSAQTGAIRPMLYFSKKNIVNTATPDIGNIALAHAGWVMAIHFKNSSSAQIDLPVEMFLSSSSGTNWAWNGKGLFENVTFDVSTKTFSASNTDQTLNLFINRYNWNPLYGQKLASGSSIIFYRWVASKPNVPELKVSAYIAGSNRTASSRLPSKGVENGRVYHVYTEFDNNSDFKLSNVPQWQEGTLGGLNVPTPETYPLWVGGVQVNEFNASAITGTGITGSVSYDHGTKTLTLDNATITGAKIDSDHASETDYFSGIESTNDSLTINLIGTNVINLNILGDPFYNQIGRGVKVGGHLKFTGNDTLHIAQVTAQQALQESYTGIYANSVVIYGSTVMIAGSPIDNSILVTDEQGGLALYDGAILDCKANILLKEQPIVYAGAVLKEGDTEGSLEVVEQFTLNTWGQYFRTKRFIRIEPSITGITTPQTEPLAIYPNPANDAITVETEAIGSAITITDLAGRMVMTATATDSQTTLGIRHLSAGTYIVRVGDRITKMVKM